MAPVSDLKSPDNVIAADAPLPANATGILTINLDAIVANWRKLSSQAVPADCAAVVKADAYGCGITQVTRALAKAGCRTFFVATLDEARAVRDVTPTSAIYMLDGFFPGAGDQYAKFDCRPVIGDATELAEWDAFRKTSGWDGQAAIQIDIGMNRLGFRASEAEALLPRIKNGNHGISLVLGHLTSAELLNDPANGRQVAAFREIASQFSSVPASLANSSGIFLGPQFHFDVVRPGAALYGVNPTPEADTPMQPVLDLKVRVAQVRNLEKGEHVGYGGTWTARQPTRLAIVTAGYADGYFRAAGSIDNMRSAEVMVAGQRCPVAGRISMDLMAIDITAIPPGATRRGALVSLLNNEITVDELAHHFGTIGYEVLTSLGKRYVRAYKGGQ